MACGVLFLLSAMSYGCIIPDRLEPPLKDINFQPVFVPSEVVPPFGQVLPGDANSTLDLKFVVDDQNVLDTLRVRVFTKRGPTRQRVPLPFEVVLDSANDAQHPNRRVGKPLIPTDYCNLVENPSATSDLIAIVCDRTFGGGADMGSSPDQCPMGLTDERIWTLECQ
jgi:hypothetical protein